MDVNHARLVDLPLFETAVVFICLPLLFVAATLLIRKWLRARRAAQEAAGNMPKTSPVLPEASR